MTPDILNHGLDPMLTRYLHRLEESSAPMAAKRYVRQFQPVPGVLQRLSMHVRHGVSYFLQ